MKLTLISFLLVFTVILANAQEPVKISKKEKRAEKVDQKKETIKKLVESRSFVFDPRTAYSAEAGNVVISYPYNLKLENDSIYSYLPFYGRAYNVEYGSTESPMVFDLPVQEMEIIKNKNKGYHIEVKVKRDMDVIVFGFNVSETGTTTLTVNSTNRQVITYNGELSEKQEEEKSL